MSRPLARRIASLRPSGTLAMDARARALAAGGVSVVNLSAGQPDFPTPAHILDAAARAMRAGQTRYTDTAGTRELRAAVAAHLTARAGRALAVEDVLISAGVKHALSNVLLASVSEGDEVVLPVPAWGTYAEQVRLAGGRPVPLTLGEDDGFQIREAALRRVVTPRTVAVLVNSPSNPTGAVLDEPALAAIEAVAVQHDLLVLSDEIYDRVVYDGVRPVSPAAVSRAMAGRTVILNGVSKAYAMTGWRIGYAAGPRELIAAAVRVQEQVSGNACSVSQAASLAALTGPDEPVRRMVEEFAARRRTALGALAAWPSTRVRPPEGAFYLFPRIEWDEAALARSGWSAGGVGLAEYLLEIARVAVVPGEAFDALPGYLRLSFAASEPDLLEGIRRIGEALERVARGGTACRPMTTSA